MTLDQNTLNVHTARFRWPKAQRGIGTKKEVDYFYQFYPVRGIGKTLEYTYVNMLTHSYIPLTKGEFFKYLGLRLAMACEPKRGAIPVHWDEGLKPGTIYSGASFGERFGMSRHRFEIITQSPP